jgi:hypothetical protein
MSSGVALALTVYDGGTLGTASNQRCKKLPLPQLAPLPLPVLVLVLVLVVGVWKIACGDCVGWWRPLRRRKRSFNTHETLIALMYGRERCNDKLNAIFLTPNSHSPSTKYQTPLPLHRTWTSSTVLISSSAL